MSLVSATCAALGCADAPPAAARWSAPVSPAGCASARARGSLPQVVFPSSEPAAASGPGALLWSAPRGCGAPGAQIEGTGAAAAGVTLAADDRPGRGRPLSAAADLATVTAAVGTAAGQVVALGTASGRADGMAPGAAPGGRGATAAGTAVAPTAAGAAASGGGSATARGGVGVTTPRGAGAFAEGPAVGRFSPARPLGGLATPVAVASGYLGDVVVASPAWTPRTGWAVAVRVQRHYDSALGAPRLVPVGADPEAVAAAMDYRAEALLVWVARGGVYARELAQGGALGPVRRLGVLPPGAAAPEAQALLSDDGHAIVAWRADSPARGGGTLTTLQLSCFEVGVGAVAPPPPTVVERLHDRPGLPRPPGALRLVRLSSEAVMMAWTGRVGGRYVVRASPVSLRRGAWAPVTISGASQEDAALAALVPGPHAEAFAVWRAISPGPHAGAGRASPAGSGVAAALLAARGHYAGHGEVAFEAPETVAPSGPNGPPAAAVDPSTGVAVAAWVMFARPPGGAAGGRVVYAVRAPEPAPTTSAAATHVAARSLAHAASRTPAHAAPGTPAYAVPGTGPTHPVSRPAAGGAFVSVLLAVVTLLCAAVTGWGFATHRAGRRRAPPRRS